MYISTHTEYWRASFGLHAQISRSAFVLCMSGKVGLSEYCRSVQAPRALNGGYLLTQAVR